MDESRIVMGASVGARSKRDAELAAIVDCNARGGGVGCKARMLAYENQCVVVATGDNFNKAVAAESIQVASELALQACEDEHGGNCHVYYSDCSVPVRTQ